MSTTKRGGGPPRDKPPGDKPEQSKTMLEQILEDESVRVIEAGALEAINRAEIDVQIATARKYPRSIKAFLDQALALATLDEETAASCYYRLRRDGKVIEGPSIRMAEIVLSTYGNMRSGSRIVGVGDRTITGQGFAHDLEKNNASAVEVDRRITTREGKRYGDDMIVVTGNAACSIALRNAVFRVIPRAIIKPILDQAKDVSLGKGKTMEQRRAEFVAWYVKRGATEKQVLASLDRKGVEDLTLDDLLTLRGMATAIKDGELTLAEALRTPEEKAIARGARSADWDLGATLAGKPEPQPEEATSSATETTDTTTDTTTTAAPDGDPSDKDAP